MKRKDLVIGTWPVIEALRSDNAVDKIMIRRGASGEQITEIKRLARELNVPIQQVPPPKLDRTTKGEHQGVIAFISPVPVQDLHEIITRTYELGETPLLLALDGVTDVRNLGAIARSAECLGAHAIVVPSAGSAKLGEDAVKSSAGALLRIPICRVDDIARCAKDLQEQGLKVIACTEKGTDLIPTADLTTPTLLVLGDEGGGLSPSLLRMADHLMRIPMTGKIGSLNVSVSAGIVLYEVARQRTVQTA